MKETNVTNSTLKKVLIHVIGWPLFFVAIYWCFIGGAFIGWVVQFFSGSSRYLFTDFETNFAPFQDDNRRALVAFVGGTAVLSFLSSFIFATFIFERRIVKIIFSSLIAFSCVFLLLWWSYEIIEWGYERTSNIGCVLGINPGHVQECVTMSEQERRKFMKENDITEKDLENYKKRYPKNRYPQNVIEQLQSLN